MRLQGGEGFITLLLGASKSDGQARDVFLLLADQMAETLGFALVAFNLHLQLLRFLGELLCKRLEFEELFLPVLQLVDQEGIALVDLGEFRVHSLLERNQVVPRVGGLVRILVSFSCDFIEVSDGHLCRQWPLGGAVEQSSHAGIASLS